MGIKRVILIIQARMGATRLPGKVLKAVMGKPLLSYLVERLKRVKKVDQLVLATTTNPSDDVLMEFCVKEHLPFFRGSEENVLDRFLQTARIYKGEVIVRITADCPLIDPAIVDEAIDFFLNHPYDYVSDVLTRTYPRGMDVEVFSISSFEKVAKEAQREDEKEHVTPYYLRHPEQFKLGQVTSKENNSHLRLTVDTPEDFTLIKTLLEELYPKNRKFTLEDILKTLKAHPEWVQINAHVKQRILDLS